MPCDAGCAGDDRARGRRLGARRPCRCSTRQSPMAAAQSRRKPCASMLGPCRSRPHRRPVRACRAEAMSPAALARISRRSTRPAPIPVVVLTDLADFTHLVTRLKYVPDAANDPSLSEVERMRRASSSLEGDCGDDAVADLADAVEGHSGNGKLFAPGRCGRNGADTAGTCGASAVARRCRASPCSNSPRRRAVRVVAGAERVTVAATVSRVP